MTALRCIILVQIATTAALGQLDQPRETAKQTARSDAVVRSFYREIVARHPLGIPRRGDMKALAPYISNALARRLDTALACESDYYRLHHDPTLKPQIEWLEFGLFSGAWEEALPASFHVKGTQPEKDGSFHVDVRFTYGKPGDALRWHVTVIVVEESQHFVVDDVIYLKDEGDPGDVEPPLSKVLTLGCDGPRWVGYETDEVR